MAERLTVLVTTFNEEDRLAECLESARFADEVLVVDSLSTDGTIAIAREHADRVFEHEFVDSATQINWALQHVKTRWVLVVDADERVTPELAEEIRALLDRGPPSDAYRMLRANHFLGRRLKHGGWHRDKVIRLFRADKLRYEQRRVHARVAVEDPVPMLDGLLVHYTFRDFDHYLEKVKRFSRWGAEEAFRNGRRATLWHLVAHPLHRFVKGYVLRLGFLDGRPGLIIAVLGSYSVFLKYARLWEMRRRRGRRPCPDRVRPRREPPP